MRDYDNLLKQQRGPFTVYVDKTWEDIHPSDCFEEEDVAEICRKIDDGTYEWFMLRVRVEFEGVELADEYLGGCCYEDSRDVLTDGTAEDMIYQALIEAKKQAAVMKTNFQALDLDQEEVVYFGA